MAKPVLGNKKFDSMLQGACKTIEHVLNNVSVRQYDGETLCDMQVVRDKFNKLDIEKWLNIRVQQSDGGRVGASRKYNKE